MHNKIRRDKEGKNMGDTLSVMDENQSQCLSNSMDLEIN